MDKKEIIKPYLLGLLHIILIPLLLIPWAYVGFTNGMLFVLWVTDLELVFWPVGIIVATFISFLTIKNDLRAMDKTRKFNTIALGVPTVLFIAFFIVAYTSHDVGKIFPFIIPILVYVVSSYALLQLFRKDI